MRSSFVMVLWLLPMVGLSQDLVVLKTNSIPAAESIVSGIVSVCGEDHTIETLDMRGKMRKGKQLVAQIEQRISLDENLVVFTIGTPATRLAAKALKNTPIILSLVNNPEQQGFTQKNISGVSHDISFDRQLSALKEILPSIKKIGVVFDPEKSGENVQTLQQSASNLQLTLVREKVVSQKDVPKAIRKVMTQVDALIFLPDSTVINGSSLKYIASVTLENRIPTLVYSDFLVKYGFLMALSPDNRQVGVQAGKHFCGSGNKVTQGVAKIESPQIVSLSINMKTAKRLQLEIPADMVSGAAKVYE